MTKTILIELVIAVVLILAFIKEITEDKDGA